MRILPMLLVAVCLTGLARSAAAQRFTPAPATQFPVDTADGSGVVFADVDNDGDDDILLAVIGAPNRLYRNDGGRFTRVTDGELVNVSHFHFGLAAADVNNDGLVDIFQANSQSRLGSLMYRGTANGFLRADRWYGGSEPVLAWSPAFGDYDNDGFVDLVLTHPFGFSGTPATSNFLFQNNGDGTFSRRDNTPISAATGPYTIASWADWDEDGDLDLAISAGPANGTIAPDFLFRNRLRETGRATFERVTDSPIGTDSLDGQVWTFEDVDNDGDRDAFITNYAGTGRGMRNHLYRNEGGRFVRDTTAGTIVTDADVSLGSVWGDYDNDGDLDLFVTNGGSPNARGRFYRNRGDGTFEADSLIAPAAARGPVWGASAGDVDDDGDLDLYVSAKAIGPNRRAGVLYRNDLAPGNQWLTLDLVGSRSNRLGIGARVRAYARLGGRPVQQFREVSTQNTFSGHNSLRVHFGLRDAATVDSLVILWPSGQRDVHRNVAAGRRLRAAEGGALTPVPRP